MHLQNMTRRGFVLTGVCFFAQAGWPASAISNKPLVMAAATSDAPAAITPELMERYRIYGLDAVAVSEVVRRLKAAMRDRNLNELRNVSRSPLSLYSNGSLISLVSLEDFTRNEEKIFTTRMGAVVDAASIDDLFLNAQGAMIGDGDVWISSVCNDRACTQRETKVITLNTMGQ